MVTLTGTELERRSTEAARAYVLKARDRLYAEHRRYGREAEAHLSYQRLEQSITSDELARQWPHADIDVALAP